MSRKPTYEDLERLVQKLKKQSSLEREELYRSLFESNHSIMLIVDPEAGEIVDANARACAFYGYSKQEMTKMKVTDINTLPEEKVFRVIEQVNAEKKGNFHFEHRLANGELRNVQVFTGPIKLQGRNLFFSIILDVTERLRAEKKIRKQNQFLNTVIEALTYPFYVIDAESYQIVMANSMTAPEKDWQGRTCYALTHHRKSPCHYDAEHPCPLEEVKRLREPVVVEHVHYDKEGQKRNVEVNAYPIFDDSGNLIQIIEYCVDVTRRKELEQEREKLIADLQEALSEVKTLSGFLPICMSCKKIRDDKGYWNQIEAYIRDHSEAEFSHGICPDCAKKLYHQL